MPASDFADILLALLTSEVQEYARSQEMALDDVEVYASPVVPADTDCVIACVTGVSLLGAVYSTDSGLALCDSSAPQPVSLLYLCGRLKGFSADSGVDVFPCPLYMRSADSPVLCIDFPCSSTASPSDFVFFSVRANVDLE